MKGLIGIISVWVLLSCNANTDPMPTLQGTYVGNFQRDNNRTHQVELTFTGNRYSGKVAPSERVNYDATAPVICRGSFVIDQQTIDFQDECVYTANFDWTLILSQRWTFSINNNLLFLSRDKDRYVLTKK